MMQIVQQTHDEKIKMYLKFSKRELAEMLINTNDLLTKLTDPPMISGGTGTPLGPERKPGEITWMSREGDMRFYD